MSYTVKELRALPDDRLIAEHDAEAQHTVTGTPYYLEELARRDANAQGDRIESLTETVVRLTWLIAGLTLVNVIAVLVDAS